MSVRAKFRCDGITVRGSKQEQTFTIELNPVVGGSEENDKFYKYTPGGSIELATINPEAGKQFEVGEEYYIDFTHVDN